MTTPTGTSPATMGRRVAARALDATIALVLAVAVDLTLVAALLGSGDMGPTYLVLGLLLAWSAYGLWAVLARGALPGQLMLGLHHVDAGTGRRAGGRTLLKYLVQACTCGLAILITPLSIRSPNRSWFDRVAGVTLVDARRVAPATGTTAVAAPPAGWQGEESLLTQAGLPPEPPLGDRAPTPGAMIDAVPYAAGGTALTGSAPPAVERPVAAPVAPLVQAPPAPMPVRPAPATSVPVASARVAVAVLDDGRRFPVLGTLVLGRDPRPSTALGPATSVVLDDRSVSANHVALGLGPTGPWAMDLRSTNGSWVEQGGAAEQRLDPMVRVALVPGAVLRVGRLRVTVTAS